MKWFNYHVVLLALWIFFVMVVMFAPFGFPDNPPWWLILGWAVSVILGIGTAKPISEWFDKHQDKLS